MNATNISIYLLQIKVQSGKFSMSRKGSEVLQLKKKISNFFYLYLFAAQIRNISVQNANFKLIQITKTSTKVSHTVPQDIH